jgi:DNA-binding phage protein
MLREGLRLIEQLDDAMAELYRNDPALTIDVVNSILKDGDQVALLILLRQMTQAFGGVQAVAEQNRRT